MEGLPGLPLIWIPLRTAEEEANFSTALGKIIREKYDADPAVFTNEFNEINVCRRLAVAYAKVDSATLKNMQLYILQAGRLRGRFGNELEMKFVWTDAFSTNYSSSDELRFDEANVLWNIAALFSFFGAKEVRSGDESLKKAVANLQLAAGTFESVAQKFADFAKQSAEFDTELLQLLSMLMLAQAHEVIFEKSLRDGRRPASCALLSAGIAGQYKSLAQRFDSDKSRSSSGVSLSSVFSTALAKTWRKLFELKRDFYEAVQFVESGLHAEANSQFGEALAYFDLSKSTAERCIESVAKLSNASESNLNEPVRFLLDVATAKYDASKRDNDLVYHDRVPTAAALRDREARSITLARSATINWEDPELSQVDPFARLVPAEVVANASVYSDRLAELLRQTVAEVDAANSKLSEELRSRTIDPEKLRLDVLLSENSGDAERVLVEEAAVGELFDLVSRLRSSEAETGVTQLCASMSDLASCVVDVQDLLETLRNAIECELTDDNESDRRLIGDCRSELAELEAALNAANRTNEELQVRVRVDLDAIRWLKQFNTRAALNAVLPDPFGRFAPLLQATDNSDPELRTHIAEVVRILSKLEEMKKQRVMLIEQLRSETLADSIIEALLARAHEQVEAVFSDHMKKHDSTLSLIRANINAQPNIVRALDDAANRCAEFVANFYSAVDERRDRIRSLIQSASKLNSLVAKVHEGISFFKQCERALQNIQQKLAEPLAKSRQRRHLAAKRRVEPPMPKAVTLPSSSERMTLDEARLMLEAASASALADANGSMPPIRPSGSFGGPGPMATVAGNYPMQMPPAMQGASAVNPTPDELTQALASGMLQLGGSGGRLTLKDVMGARKMAAAAAAGRPAQDQAPGPGQFQSGPSQLAQTGLSPHGGPAPSQPQGGFSQGGPDPSNPGQLHAMYSGAGSAPGPNTGNFGPVNGSGPKGHDPFTGFGPGASSQSQPGFGLAGNAGPANGRGANPTNLGAFIGRDSAMPSSLAGFSAPNGPAPNATGFNAAGSNVPGQPQAAYGLSGGPAPPQAGLGLHPGPNVNNLPYGSNAAMMTQAQFNSSQNAALPVGPHQYAPSGGAPNFLPQQPPPPPAVPSFSPAAMPSETRVAYSSPMPTPQQAQAVSRYPQGHYNAGFPPVPSQFGVSTPDMFAAPLQVQPNTGSQTPSAAQTQSNPAQPQAGQYVSSAPTQQFHAHPNSSFVQPHNYASPQTQAQAQAQEQTQAQFAYSQQHQNTSATPANTYAPHLHPQSQSQSMAPQSQARLPVQTNSVSQSVSPVLPSQQNTTNAAAYPQQQLHSSASQQQIAQQSQFSGPVASFPGASLPPAANYAHSQPSGVSQQSFVPNQPRAPPPNTYNAQQPYGMYTQPSANVQQTVSAAGSYRPNQYKVSDVDLDALFSADMNSLTPPLCPTPLAPLSSAAVIPQSQPQPQPQTQAQAQPQTQAQAQAQPASDPIPVVPTNVPEFKNQQPLKQVDILSGSPRLSASSNDQNDAYSSASGAGVAQRDELEASIELKPHQVTADELVISKKEEQLKTVLRSSSMTEWLADNLRVNRFVCELEKFARLVQVRFSAENRLVAIWNELAEADANWLRTEVAPGSTRAALSSIGKCYAMKNRDNLYLPFDANRVALREARDDYINASSLDAIGDTCAPLVLTQWPLPHTLGDFWLLVFELGCEVIACLANGKREQLNPPTYWPCNKGEPLRAGAIEVTLQVTKEHEAGWTERIFTLRNVKTAALRSVVHLECALFDSQLPTAGNFEGNAYDRFLKFINETHNLYAQQRSLVRPVVVHCSTGCGRSGLFVLTYAAIRHVLVNGTLPDVAAMLRHLRTLRRGLVETKEQLAFAYESVLHYSTQMLEKRGIQVNLPRSPLKNARNAGQQQQQPSDAQSAPGGGLVSSPASSSINQPKSHSRHPSITGMQKRTDGSLPQPAPVSIDTLDLLFTDKPLSVLDLKCVVVDKMGARAANDSLNSTLTSAQASEPVLQPVEAQPEASVETAATNGRNSGNEQHSEQVKGGSNSTKTAKLVLPDSLKDLEDPEKFSLSASSPGKRRNTRQAFANPEIARLADMSDPFAQLDPLANIGAPVQPAAAPIAFTSVQQQSASSLS